MKLKLVCLKFGDYRIFDSLAWVDESSAFTQGSRETLHCQGQTMLAKKHKASLALDFQFPTNKAQEFRRKREKFSIFFLDSFAGEIKVGVENWKRELGLLSLKKLCGFAGNFWSVPLGANIFFQVENLKQACNFPLLA